MHELEERGELFAGEAFDLVLVIEADDLFHEGQFFLDELVDVLFDGPLGHHLEDLDAAALADPVDPVGGLIFFGGVPPAVVVDDDGGGR